MVESGAEKVPVDLRDQLSVSRIIGVHQKKTDEIFQVTEKVGKWRLVVVAARLSGSFMINKVMGSSPLDFFLIFLPHLFFKLLKELLAAVVA